MERRSLLIGCSAFALVVLMLGASFYLYWTAPSDVPIPPAPVPPPGNAYDAYLQVMRKTRDMDASVPGLPDITRKALMRGADASHLRRYVQVYEPIRREYRKHVGKPSAATNAEDINAFMQSAPMFRTWARVGSADIASRSCKPTAGGRLMTCVRCPCWRRVFGTVHRSLPT